MGAPPSSIATMMRPAPAATDCQNWQARRCQMLL